MSTKLLQIYDIDNGFCRINYVAKNSNNLRVCYCLQDEGENYGGVTQYRSTQDWEPDNKVTSKKKIWEVPTGNSDIEIAVRAYLTKDKQ